MKLVYLNIICLLAIVVYVQCDSLFVGTNVMRHQVYHKVARYGSKFAQKRVENLNFTIPNNRNYGFHRIIAGVLAYDLTNSGASVNVTGGGVGNNFVKLRMKSDRGKPLKYDVYVYV